MKKEKKSVSQSRSYTFNQHGVVVCKICASCRFCNPDTLKTRICSNGRGAVLPSSTCEYWIIKTPLNNAGGAVDGKILSKHYIDYLVAAVDKWYETHEGKTTTAEFNTYLKGVKQEYLEIYNTQYMNI